IISSSAFGRIDCNFKSNSEAVNLVVACMTLRPFKKGFKLAERLQSAHGASPVIIQPAGWLKDSACRQTVNLVRPLTVAYHQDRFFIWLSECVTDGLASPSVPLRTISMEFQLL